jgi:hypothetical protein
MTFSSHSTLSACILALALAGTPMRAQGVIDRLLGDDPRRTINPADLTAAGIWIYDPVQGLSNFPESDMRAGPHMMVVLTKNTQVPSVVLRLESGAECAKAAVSMTGIHGGGLAYCHPLAP